MANNSQQLAQRVNTIKASPTNVIAAKARELKNLGKPVINLSLGESDFDTPQHIKEAAIKALEDGFTKYTDVGGTLSLREAIVHKFARDNHLNYTPKEIIVSTGAKQCIFNFFCALLNPQDEVIIPAPYWVSYPDMVLLNEGRPVIVEGKDTNQLKITPEQLSAAITPRTRIVVFNTPSNPTGMAYTGEELHALGEVLLKHPDIWIISDDIYEHNLWNHLPFKNILNVCPQLAERCLIVNGVAKAYAMTGWRIGFAGGPAHLIKAMEKVQSQTTSCANSIAQYATQAALLGDQSCLTVMTSAYKERHDYLVPELQKLGFECHPSDGTFYTFPSIKKLMQSFPKCKNDIDFAAFLLDAAEIAVVPGSAFGAEGYLRFSYATDLNNLKLAISRLQKLNFPKT